MDRAADHLLQGIDQLGWVKPELASLAVARPLLTVDNQPLQYELISTPSPSTADFVKSRSQETSQCFSFNGPRRRRPRIRKPVFRFA